jgi:hypothetical protein
MSSLLFLLSESVRTTLLIGYAKARTAEGGNGRSRTRNCEVSMEGVDWSSGEGPVDDSFALEKGMRGRGWRVVILKCVEKLGTGEEVQKRTSA